jgi:hypothetical protein
MAEINTTFPTMPTIPVARKPGGTPGAYNGSSVSASGIPNHLHSGMEWAQANEILNKAIDRIEALEDKVQALNEAKWQAEDNVAQMTEMFEELLDQMRKLEEQVERYSADKQHGGTAADAEYQKMLEYEKQLAKTMESILQRDKPPVPPKPPAQPYYSFNKAIKTKRRK